MKREVKEFMKVLVAMVLTGTAYLVLYQLSFYVWPEGTLGP